MKSSHRELWHLPRTHSLRTSARACCRRQKNSGKTVRLGTDLCSTTVGGKHAIAAREPFAGSASRFPLSNARPGRPAVARWLRPARPAAI